MARGVPWWRTAERSFGDRIKHRDRSNRGLHGFVRLLVMSANVVLVATVTVLVPAAAASAVIPETVHWPTVQYNHRGSEVKALQWLLRGWGYDPGSIDGAFGSGTRSKVQQWQSSRGLPADGYMIKTDWEMITPWLSKGRPGMKRDHVRALQHLLNVKNGAGLVVDGLFGTGTKNAVKAFQQHRGLTVDGVVGPATWKNLLWHYERMTDTSTTCRTASAWYEREEWGHGTTVAAVMKAASNLKAYWPRVELPFWDLSYEHGGSVGHASHKRGMDVDIGVITTNNGHCSGRSANRWSSNYSWQATSRLVTDLRKGADWNTDGMISLIYFNDVRVKNDQPPTLVRPYSGHDDHLHVRYCARSEGSVHSSSEETKWSGGNCT